MKIRCIVISFAITLLIGSTPGRADDVNGAAKAFSQAQEAMLSGDAARAADLYELADELSPAAPALRNATRARLAAGHLATAATNAAALLRRYPSDKESREMAEAILSQLAPQLAQLDLGCSAACTVLIDGKVVASVAREQHSLFTQPGARTVTAVFDDNRKAINQITAMPNRITTIRLEAPAQPAAPRTAPARGAPDQALAARHGGSSRGISRWWVVGGGVATLGLGAATIVSGMATLSTRDKIRDAVAANSTGTAVDFYNTGRDQQLRTNVLLGATAAAGIGTAVLAILANWSDTPAENDVAVVPTRNSVSLVYGRPF
jgi:hypothetical protein